MAKMKVDKFNHVICPSGHDMGDAEVLMFEEMDKLEFREGAKALLKNWDTFGVPTGWGYNEYHMGNHNMSRALVMTEFEQTEIIKAHYTDKSADDCIEAHVHTPHFVEMTELICECKQCGAKVRLLPELRLSSILVSDYSHKLIKDIQIKDTEKHGWTRDPSDTSKKRSNVSRRLEEKRE